MKFSAMYGFLTEQRKECSVGLQKFNQKAHNIFFR